MTTKQNLALLRLFKGYKQEFEDKVDKEFLSSEQQEQFNLSTLQKGILFDDVSIPISQEILYYAYDLYGKVSEEWNKTLHKSFKIVEDSDEEVLLVQQILHYITTYGSEALCIYDTNSIYIPNEVLKIPETDIDGLTITVLHSMTSDDIREKLRNFLTTGLALSKETLEDVLTLAEFIDEDKLYQVKNKELRTRLYDKFGIVPNNAEEFFRYLIYKITGESLIIVNKFMFDKIKSADTSETLRLLQKYIDHNSIEELSTLGYRYRELFMAMKSKEECSDAKTINKLINKLIRLAEKHREPANVDILSRLSCMTYDVFRLTRDAIMTELDKVTIFKEASILNGLKYRVTQPKSIMYKIRNGKAYVDNEVNITDEQAANIFKIYDCVYHHFTQRVGKLLKGKEIYLPENIDYAMPTSEKQLVSNVPYGSYISVPIKDNMIFGINWYDVVDERVDLDLHLQNNEEHFGWNHNTKSSDVIFTGDVTAAPNGATELYLIKQDTSSRSYLVTINKYAGPDDNTKFKLVVGSSTRDTLPNNYVLATNEIITTLPFKFSSDMPESREMTLGTVEVTDKEIKFYFNNFAIGTSILSEGTDVVKGAYDYLTLSTNCQLRLRDILINADVKILDTPEKETLEGVTITNENGDQETLYKKVIQAPDIDLTFEKLDKTTFIDMFNENKE